MSYVTIYGIDSEGDVERYGEAKNNHGYAPLVWQYLTVQYGIHPTGKPYDLTPMWNYQPLWDMEKAGKLERLDALLLGSTYDRVWVRRALVPELIEGMRAFHKRYVVPNNFVETISEAADRLTEWLAGNPDDRGVAFNMCSADSSFWEVYDPEAEESRPYNIDRDPGGKDRHWEFLAEK